jgi:DNA (cytosine-5)-methyltransferase 1
MLTFGELFAGIGGFSLGLERAGMQCKWQVEIEPYARAVLKKHWPEVPKHDDVRTFPPQGDYSVDLICGGFPCQDISVAGKGAGLAGARSGLWYEFARIIGEIRPRYVLVENVGALLTRGMDAVLGTLSTLGYDAEWHVVPASAVGAPHRRDRVWIVAYANVPDGKNVRPNSGSRDARAGSQRFSERRAILPVDCGSREKPDVADAEGISGRAGLCEGGPEQDGHQSGDRRGDVPDADCAGRQQQRRAEPIPAEQLAAECGGWWESEPDVGRVAHGVPSRVDRLRCLGNAVVPQVVEVIGRAIVEHEKNRTASGMRP